MEVSLIETLYIFYLHFNWQIVKHRNKMQLSVNSIATSDESMLTIVLDKVLTHLYI